jgi:foldase protein PrsA
MRALSIGIVAALAAVGPSNRNLAGEAAPAGPPPAAAPGEKKAEAGGKAAEKAAAPAPRPESNLPPGVLARVNGNEVTVDDYVKYLFASTGRSKLREYIDRLLLEEEARRAQIQPPTPEEVEEKVNALIESSMRTLYQNSQEKYAESLARQGLTPDDRKAKLRQDNAYRMLEERTIVKTRQITEEDILKEFERVYGKGGVQYELRHIFFSISRARLQNNSGDSKRLQDADQEARDKAEKVLKEIQGGADFGQMAKTHSNDELTRGNEGRIPVYQRGYRGPDFDDAVARLTEQQPLSGVVKIPQGYEIIQLLSRKVVLLADKREEIVNQLKTKTPTPAERNAFIKGLREKAKIEI